MKNYHLAYAGSFILIAKTLKGINLITDTPLKIFIGLIKCVEMSLRLCLTLSIAIFQRFLRNKTLSLPQKAKKLKV
ncbi:hypothetical protein [Helicobacter pylori]|uniref:hypothetical protein n=1 Tax=Helicobacter pylori TaxID=210 RepID=UPI003464EAF8